MDEGRAMFAIVAALVGALLSAFKVGAGLVDDMACATQESAFVVAMQQYAPCYTAAHGE
jgi:hypothetical protein